MAVKAYVLVVTDPGATKKVYDALAAVKGVVEIHEVMGPYDIVIEISVPSLVDVPPTQDGYQPREWEKPHRPNLTGTPQAYRPAGSTLASGKRPKATGDYQPWTPG